MNAPSQTKRVCRPFSQHELDELKGLWASVASDNQLVSWFGRHRSVIRRVAQERLGLPPRVTARARAFEGQMHPYRIIP
jgi:hypothetical protein